MIRRFPLAIALMVLSILHIFMLGKTAEIARNLPHDDATDFVISGPLLKIISLEYDGLLSDYVFIKGMVFLGNRLDKEKKLHLSKQDWRWVNQIFSISTDLDPYFVDPYYVVNAFLTWDGNMVQEANSLLEKGSRAREWDWSLPFFIGFNEFYFLENNDKASHYLMEASRRPGANPILADLAARLAFKAKKTENSILFMQEMLRKTEDGSLKEQLEIRLEALQNILFIEQAVKRYHDRFRRGPAKLKDLVAKGIIREVPQDPYGGSYFIDTDGAIRSTSSQLLETYTSPQHH